MTKPVLHRGLAQDGYQPLTEGYRPVHERGHQPAPSTKAPPKPPSGGSSIMPAAPALTPKVTTGNGQ